MSSSGFNVIRKHSSDATSIRIKELTQALAKQASDLAGSQLETDDVRSQGRMDHSTIKLNDESLKFVTTLQSANTDFFYEFPTEPDLNYLKVWFMLDHLGSKMRDMSGLGNDAFISGHPTLRRIGLDIGFQQTSAGGGLSATPAMLFNSGQDVVSSTNGEYIWVNDNDSIKFTLFPVGFSITFRFRCLDFKSHVSSEFGTFVRRFAVKTDDALNGWNLVVYNTNVEGTTGGIEMNVLHNGVTYKRRSTGYSVNSWYQVVVTYDPNMSADNRIKIYTAGVESSLAGLTSLILPTFTNLRIGARDAETGFFYGYLHDFRVYMGKVLTQTEITNINTNEMTIDNITKGHAFVVQYAMVSQVLRSKIHKYNVGGFIIRTRKHKYNVIKKLTVTKTHKFNMVTGVLKTRTHKFNIVKLVSRTRTHRYGMGGTVRLTKTHKFNIIQKITITKTHKFSVGGLQTQFKRFQKSTTAGSNIVQEVTFNATPQAIIIWSDGSTSADNTYADGFHNYYGFSDGTHHACVSSISIDNLGTTDTFSGHKSDKVIAMMDNTSGTVASEATVSFGASKATFTWTTNDNRAVNINCMAFYGLNNVEVKTFQAGTTSVGNRVYSLNNSSLVPTFIHVINRGANTIDWSTANGQCISISAAKSSARQFAVTTLNDDGSGTADTICRYDTSNCTIVGYDDDTEALEMQGNLSSYGTGTFTINWIDAPPVTNASFSVLVMDSPNIDVGTITQKTNGTGTQIYSTDTNVDNVKGLLLFTTGQTTAATWDDWSMISIGGASGTGSTAQGLIVTKDNDGADPTVSVRLGKEGSVTKVITATATASSSTTQAEASLSAFGTDQFTLNWTVADATARKYHYIAFGV